MFKEGDIVKLTRGVVRQEWVLTGIPFNKILRRDATRKLWQIVSIRANGDLGYRHLDNFNGVIEIMPLKQQTTVDFHDDDEFSGNSIWVVPAYLKKV